MGSPTTAWWWMVDDGGTLRYFYGDDRVKGTGPPPMWFSRSREAVQGCIYSHCPIRSRRVFVYDRHFDASYSPESCYDYPDSAPGLRGSWQLALQVQHIQYTSITGVLLGFWLLYTAQSSPAVHLSSIRFCKLIETWDVRFIHSFKFSSIRKYLRYYKIITLTCRWAVAFLSPNIF